MKVLVTGGGGFLGQAIVRQLLGRGDSVVTYSRGSYPELERLGVTHCQGDLTEKAHLIAAMKGSDAVIHTAAKAGMWGPYAEFFNANVYGTRQVLEACEFLGINRLVYTSSPSAIYQGDGLEGVDESIPYPDVFDGYYPQTKAAAEKLVLEANSPQLATVALRPHLIWGPADHHFLPRLVQRAKQGRLRLIGRQDHLVDHVYIDNAAESHLLALDRLQLGAKIAGKAYFITQGEPVPISTLMNGILQAAGLPPVKRHISAPLAHLAGTILETIYGTFSLAGEPPMTRFLAKQMSTPHWFRIDAARRDLDYSPRVSLSEGLERLHVWLTEHPL